MFDAFHAIGDQVGCSEKTVRRVFRGQHVSGRIRKKMSEFLGVDVSMGRLYEQLGQMAGLSRQTVWTAFKGRAVSYQTANTLSVKLKIPVEAFRIKIDGRMTIRRR